MTLILRIIKSLPLGACAEGYFSKYIINLDNYVII